MINALTHLANKARENDWTITHDEAINIWLLLPDGCERRTSHDQYTGAVTSDLFIVKGLGVFDVK